MENTGYPCPRCGTPAELTRGCAGCGLGPYPAAAEVVRLDREIVSLGREVERAREAYQGLGSRLLAAQRRRAELAARIRREIPAPTLVGAAVRPVPQAVRPVPQAVRPVAPGAHPVAPAARPVVPAARPVPPVRPGGVVASGGSVPPAGFGTPPAAEGTPGRPETSTRTIQWLLFVLGGLLLGTAAVVFTAVAWATVGVAGRALILAAFTVLALAVPLVARWRGLRGTAETFAAVGLLLVVLDGYAAWSVNLFGTADWPGTRYAALVGGISAAVATGYALLSRLTVPWFAALLAVQPVVPLAAAQSRPGPAGWTLVFLGVALLDLGVVVALRRRSPAGGEAVTDPGGSAAVVAGRVLGWLGFGAAATVAASCALVPLTLGRAAGQPLLAGLPLLLVGLVLAGAALAAGSRLFRQVTAGLLVPLLAAALLRPVAELGGGFLLLATGLVAAGLAGAVRLLPQRHRTGPRVGALLVAGGAAQVGVLATGTLAVLAATRSLPPWQGAAAGPDLPRGWQLPPAVVLAVGAVVLLLPRSARPVTLLLGVLVTAAALPAVTSTPWPTTLVVDLVVGAVLLMAVLRPGQRGSTVLVGAGAAVALTGHGLLVGLAGPGGTLAALGAVLVVGLAAPVVAGRGPGVSHAVAGTALVAALLATPALVTVALRTAGAPGWWQLRAGTLAAVLLLGVLRAVRRLRPDLHGYAATALALALAVPGPAALVGVGREPVALYAALAALVLVLADRGGVLTARPADRASGAVPGRLVAGGLALLAVLAVAPQTLRALLVPYGALVRPWSGTPGSVPVPGAPAGAVALLVLAAVAALVARRTLVGRAGPVLVALPLLASVPPVLLVAVRAPWPAVPAVVLLTGVGALLVGALAGPDGPGARPAPGVPGGAGGPAEPQRPATGWRLPAGPVVWPVGLLWTGAGLIGLLATRAGTLAGLALLVVVAALVGATGRSAPLRLLGWLAAIGAATCLAVTAPLAAALPVRAAGFAVLGVAVVVLLGGPVLAGRLRGGPADRRWARRAFEAVAQAVALVALLLTVGAPRHAAAVCVLWGAAVALRVLRRGESATARWALAAVAGGSELFGTWLLLVSGAVVLLEAYTVPAAGLALVAGLVALRTRTGLTSWLALGPGLAAGLLPSLASVLAVSDPQPWRRLLVGVAALVVVLGGAVRRWQAPVVLGGAVLTLLALHELVLSWDLLPRWSYLAVGGLALITLAATYERRRRDLVRLRAALGRMD